MSESPTDRELLQQILKRLHRIEEHLGILHSGSRIGGTDPNGPLGPREQGPVLPANLPSESKPVGPRPEPLPS